MKRLVLAVAAIGLMTMTMGEAMAADPEPQGAELMPAGPGRDIALRACSACHSLEIVAAKRGDGPVWYETVESMRGRGAVVSDDELMELAAYLTKSFPAEGAPS